MAIIVSRHARPSLTPLLRNISQFRGHANSSSRIPQILHKQKLIPDHLSPTNSRLLAISLADHLPSECLPSMPAPKRPGEGGAVAAPLPQGHHLVYYPIQARPSELHPDGTDADHWPGQPFMRRMWAGGEVRFRPGWERELVLDAREVQCVETVEDVRVSRPDGVSGKADAKAKAFVDVWRRYSPVGGEKGLPAVEERRTLVFMPELSEGVDSTSRSSPRNLKPLHKPDYSLPLTPTRALLANFSALTYNAHSIHLDTELTRADGHRALLVHGPLSLTLMFAALKGKLTSEGKGSAEAVRWLGYRNVAPLYCGEELRICLREKAEGKGDRSGDRGEGGERRWDVWVEGKEGGMAVKGTAITGPLEGW